MIKMPTRFMSPSVTELGEAAPVRLSLLLQRAPQIALSPAQRTRGPPLTIPLSMRPKMDSPDRARENRKSDRIRPVPSPSLRGGPPDRIGGSAPFRLAGPKEYR